jgi:hypothetical protein
MFSKRVCNREDIKLSFPRECVAMSDAVPTFSEEHVGASARAQPVTAKCEVAVSGTRVRIRNNVVLHPMGTFANRAAFLPCL